MEAHFNDWMSEMLNKGDALIAKVKGKKLSNFTEEEENTWLGICSEIGGFEGDDRMSRETQARYDYWFSDQWHENDPIHDMQLATEIERGFEMMQEAEEWENEKKNQIVKVRYGDLLRISKLLCMEVDFMENEDGENFYKYAKELINLPETLKKPDVTN